MELQKGENMLKHGEEIFSRPARTWFQSSKDKTKAEGRLSVHPSDPCSRSAERSRKQYEAGFGEAKESKSVGDSTPKVCRACDCRMYLRNSAVA